MLQSLSVCSVVVVCVCVNACISRQLCEANLVQGVPGLVLMLGPTKTMSSRRVNVPAESAAGILNGDRTYIPDH